MKAGDLNRKVELLRRTQTGTTDANEPIYTYTVQRTFWAALIYKSETEQFNASQRFAVRLVTFRCHHFSDIQATDRLRCDGLEYDVKGWRELGYRAGLEIAAEWRA